MYKVQMQHREGCEFCGRVHRPVWGGVGWGCCMVKVAEWRNWARFWKPKMIKTDLSVRQLWHSQIKPTTVQYYPHFLVMSFGGSSAERLPQIWKWAGGCGAWREPVNSLWPCAKGCRTIPPPHLFVAHLCSLLPFIFFPLSKFVYSAEENREGLGQLPGADGAMLADRQKAELPAPAFARPTRSSNTLHTK